MALQSAIRRFPDFELAIRRLIITDEPFRDICEEFAEAEQALAATDEMPVPFRDARKAEWQDIVDRLAIEMKVAIEMREARLRLRVRGDQPR